MNDRTTAFMRVSILAFLILSAFSVSCIMTAESVPSLLTNGGSRSVAASFLDAGRKTISAYLYEKANLYFHMGKPRKVDLAFTDSIFQRYAFALNPSEHVHASGDAVNEIMPWLWLAAKADPNNVNYYLVASFWLAHEAGQWPLARDLLAQARWNNPFSYPIAMEDGALALRHAQIDEAASLFDAGIAFCERDPGIENRDARHDMARMLLYRALIYEADGDRKNAIHHLRKIVQLFPAREEIRSRIAELESGQAPSLLASSAWSDILQAEIQKKKEHGDCEYDSHDHEGHSSDEIHERQKPH